MRPSAPTTRPIFFPGSTPPRLKSLNSTTTTTHHHHVKPTLPNRRAFLRTAATATAGVAALPLLRPRRLLAAGPGNRLNVACIGLGGQMQGLMKELTLLEANIVALCDLDENRLAFTRKAFDPDVAAAKNYHDYRDLLDKEKSVDAVVIATPDHWHAAISAAAMRAGKHVYCEKPLTHTVAEARQIAAIARETKVVTQTGNQGSASANFRRSLEIIQAGVLGPVREVHIWHPPHSWPNGVPMPAEAAPIPTGFDWNFWLGPAPVRPYQPTIYHPGNWRGWFDFGGGSLADFCCHAFSLPVRALDLDYPTRIEVSGTALALPSFPKSCEVKFSFPARGKRGPVTVRFYTGGALPPPEATAGMKESYGKVRENGCLIIGDAGTLSAGLWNNEFHIQMKGEPAFGGTNHDAVKAVPITLPRAPRERHMLEWLDACRGNGKTFSPFEIGGHVTEIGASGLLALRLGHGIDWDGAAMTAPGQPETVAWVKPQHRGDWGL